MTFGFLLIKDEGIVVPAQDYNIEILQNIYNVEIDNMTANKFDLLKLKIYRGDTETFTFNVTQDDVAVDLSGYTITAQARDKEDSDEELFEISITDGSNGNDFDAGVVVLVVPATVTAELPDSFYLDVQATYLTTIITIAKGLVEITKDVTR